MIHEEPRPQYDPAEIVILEPMDRLSRSFVIKQRGLADDYR